MSSLRGAAMGGLVALLAGGAGFLLYELSDGGNAGSFEDRINAAASAATGATSAAPARTPGSYSTEDASAAKVLNGTDTSKAAASATSPTSVAAPKTLPQLTLPDLQGKPRTLSEWQGRPLLINFWATWCEPCRREIPLLRELRAQHSKDGLEVLGIAIDFRDEVTAYAKKTGIDYPVLVAEQDATAPKAFGVGLGLPTTVVADREGRIVATHVGELDADLAGKLIGQALADSR